MIAADNRLSRSSIRDDYKLLNKIGKGSSAYVRRIKHRPTGNLYAAKIFTLAKMSDRDRSWAHREASVLATLHHPNILRVQETFTCEKYICMVTELMHCNLVEYLNRNYERLSKE